MARRLKLEKGNFYILLDACRYDIFASVVYDYLDGELEERDSGACNTSQFYQNSNIKDFRVASFNPAGKFLHHPDFVMLPSLYCEDNLDDLITGKFTCEVLHLIPPHMPPQDPKYWKLWFDTIQDYAEQEDKDKPINLGRCGVEAYFFSRLGRARVLQIYEDNLRFALRAIAERLDKLPKPLILIADHGELFGEYECWGHTEDCIKGRHILRRVPHFTVK